MSSANTVTARVIGVHDDIVSIRMLRNAEGE